MTSEFLCSVNLSACGEFRRLGRRSSFKESCVGMKGLALFLSDLGPLGIVTDDSCLLLLYSVVKDFAGPSNDKTR
jgi:hypothetical protein